MVRRNGNRSRRGFGNLIQSTREKIRDVVKPPQLESGVFWWVWGLDKGRRVVWGPFHTEEEADRKGYEKLSGYYEIVPLPTKDQATASRMLRARLLNETADTETTFKRFKHTGK